MIKKVLLLILVVILAVGLYSSFAHGVSIKLFGKTYETSSYTDIAKLSQTLVTQKKVLEDKNNIDFPKAKTRQQAAISNFRTNKSEYDELSLKASPEDIINANKKEEYYLDYLWVKIGSYANVNDVKVLIEPSSNELARINFNVSGQYIAVINFLYDLQNDEDLQFNINNVVMQGGSTSEITNASFFVGNVNIVNESH